MVSMVLIILLGIVVYSNSIDNRFIWDDHFLITNNESVKNWSGIPKVFTSDVEDGSGRRFILYRPIQMVTYMFDYSLWHLNAKGYHLTNIALHILVSLSLFWLINVLCGNTLISFLASMFFVAHPAHTEAITYISGRADSLSAFFYGGLAYLIYKKSVFRQPDEIFSYYANLYLSAFIKRI